MSVKLKKKTLILIIFSTTFPNSPSRFPSILPQPPAPLPSIFQFSHDLSLSLTHSCPHPPTTHTPDFPPFSNSRWPSPFSHSRRISPFSHNRHLLCRIKIWSSHTTLGEIITPSFISFSEEVPSLAFDGG